jgi:hypothetical protein
LPAKSHVRLEVFNMLGQWISTLIDAEQHAGEYQALFDAKALSSGMYFYRITSGVGMKTNKMLLLR